MINSDQTENEDSGRNMQDRFRIISDDLRRYVEKRIELVQLEIADRLSLMMARSIHKLLGLAFIVFSYAFFMMGLAQYLGPLLGHTSLGYLVVGGITGLLGLIFSAVKPDGLSRRMRRSWLQQVFRSEPKDVNRKVSRKRNSESGSTGNTGNQQDRKTSKNANRNKNQSNRV